MLHLDAERLAAHDHESLTSDELAHLAQCAACRHERDALVRLAALAHEDRQRTARQLTSWATLSAALRDEGLISRPSDVPEVPLAAEARVSLPVRETPIARAAIDGRALRATVATSPEQATRARRWRTTAWRAAAAVLVFASGAVVGRGTATAPLEGAADTARLASVAGVSTASLTSGSDAFRSVEDATLALERAQREYERASLWLASHDTTVNAQSVYRARLAALEQMLNASRAGLFEAPQDPVLNQYYLAAYTAREATLRQLGESMPVDRVMESF